MTGGDWLWLGGIFAAVMVVGPWCFFVGMGLYFRYLQWVYDAIQWWQRGKEGA